MFDAEQPIAERPEERRGEFRRTKLNDAWSSWKRESALAAARPRDADPGAADWAGIDLMAVRIDSLERRLGRLDEEIRGWQHRRQRARRLAVAGALVALTVAVLLPIARPIARATGSRSATPSSGSVIEDPLETRGSSVPGLIP